MLARSLTVDCGTPRRQTDGSDDAARAGEQRQSTTGSQEALRRLRADACRPYPRHRSLRARKTQHVTQNIQQAMVHLLTNTGFL